MKRLILIPFFLITGCSSQTIVQGPDGTPHNLVSCLNLADCYNEAARLCNNGKYTIVHTANQSGYGSGGAFYSGQPSRVNILIKCEKPAVGTETK